MRVRLIRLFLICALLQPISGVCAQIQIGTIKGTITDPNQAPVVASVWLTNSVTGEKIETTTDSTGKFIFNNVPFHRYTLRVEARGFAPQTLPVTINSNLPLELTINLS